MATRIKEKYLAEAVPALQQKFGYKNVMEIPRLEKIVINMGLGDCKDNAKALELAVTELATIAGQKPLVTKSKKSIANFKLRAGMNVGAKVTLRGDRMYEFADKLVSIVLPRVLAAYDRMACSDAKIHRVMIVCNDVQEEDRVQQSLFEGYDPVLERERQRQETILDVKRRFGKNSLVRGTDLMPKATQMERNLQIGGHRSGEQ